MTEPVTEDQGTNAPQVMASSPPSCRRGGYYDPEDPNADWSGYVPERTSRRHFDKVPPAMRVQVRPVGGGGIAPCDDVPTNEWSRPRRKIVFNSNHSPRHGRDASASACLAGKWSEKSFLIGGPVPTHDPESVESGRWETEAQASMRKMSTAVDQLTYAGRSMRVKGRKTITPANAETGKTGNNKHEQNKLDPKSMNWNDGKDPDNLVGFRAPSGVAKKSFLSGLGKELAGTIECNRFVLPAPFATDGNLPTDPYKSLDGERRKDMFIENYPCVPPGYTGKRKLIQNF